MFPSNVDLSDFESSPNGMGWVHLDNLAELIAYESDTFMKRIEQQAEKLGDGASEYFKVFRFMLDLLDKNALLSLGINLNQASADYHNALKNRDASDAELQLLQVKWKEAVILGDANLRVIRDTLKDFESQTTVFGGQRLMPILPKNTIFIEELEFFKKYLHMNKAEIDELLMDIENRIVSSSDISLLGPMQIVLDNFRRLEEMVSPIEEVEKRSKELNAELGRHSSICTQHKSQLVRTVYTIRPLGRFAWYRLSETARTRN
jgi:hypothetical protein